jgi:hypothetical protein
MRNELGTFARGKATGILRVPPPLAFPQKCPRPPLRGVQEGHRLTAAALYAMVALGMQVWRDTPERVDELFDVNLLRRPAQSAPAAPADTAYDPATRPLSASEIPADATHLLAYRQGEGAAPELLAIGEADELTAGIPSIYTSDSGASYDLWLVAKNSKGESPAGSVIFYVSL